MGVAAEAPKDSAVYDVTDLTSCAGLGQGFHASSLGLLVGEGGRSGLLSVHLLALHLVRVVFAIVKSVATWFEVGNRICGSDT